MTKLQIISDKNKKSLKIKKIVTDKINSQQFKNNNLVIVIAHALVAQLVEQLICNQ